MFNNDLDPRIVNDSEFICRFDLCELRLIKDGDLDWFLLIPQRKNVTEVFHLSEDDHLKLIKEINFVSKIISKKTSCTKINIASIGNMVPQMHVHVISRYDNDRAWPGVIWGTDSVKSFDISKVGYWRAIFDNAPSNFQ